MSSLANLGTFFDFDLARVDHCVISSQVEVEEGAKVVNSVLMQGVSIKKGAVVENAIIGPNSEVEENEQLNVGNKDIALYARG